MADVQIKVEIDGVQYSQDQLKELAKNGEKAADGLDDTKKSTEDVGKATKKAGDETGFFGEALEGIQETFGKLKTDAKKVASGFVSFSKGLGLSSKASKGLAIGLSALGIPLLVAGVTALIDVFKNFEGAAKVLQTVMNAAGAVVRQVTESVMALLEGDFSGAADAIAGIGDAAAEAAKQTDELFKSEKALIDLQKENVIVNAELRQESEKQQRLLDDTTLSYEERLDALQKVNDTTEKLQQNNIDESEATLRNLKAQLALAKNYEDRRELELQIAETKADLIDKETELKNIRQDAAKSEREIREEQKAELEAQRKERLKIEEDFQKKLLSLEQANELKSIENSNERAQRKIEIERQNALKEIDNAEFNEEQKRQLIEEVNEKYDRREEERQAEVAAKEEEARKKREEKRLEELDQERQAREKINEILREANLESIEDQFERSRRELNIQEQQQLKELQALGATEAEKQKIRERFSDKRKKLDEEEANFEIEMEKKVRDANLDIAAQAFGAVAQLVGENTKVAKAASIAETTIDTYVGAQKAYTSQLVPGDPTGPIRGAIAAGIAVAGGIANVQKIISTPTPGTGGGGGAGAGGGAPSQPNIPSFSPNTGSRALGEGTGIADTDAIEDIQDPEAASEQTAPIKTYVVATEVSNEQEANKKVEDAAKL